MEGNVGCGTAKSFNCCGNRLRRDRNLRKRSASHFFRAEPLSREHISKESGEIRLFAAASYFASVFYCSSLSIILSRNFNGTFLSIVSPSNNLFISPLPFLSLPLTRPFYSFHRPGLISIRVPGGGKRGSSSLFVSGCSPRTLRLHYVPFSIFIPRRHLE